MVSERASLTTNLKFLCCSYHEILYVHEFKYAVNTAFPSVPDCIDATEFIKLHCDPARFREDAQIHYPKTESLEIVGFDGSSG